jgi:hypothetical protein
VRNPAIEGLRIMGRKLTEEIEDTVSCAEQEIEPEGIIKSPLCGDPGNAF